MSRVILVPFDGSPPAHAALRSAIVIAVRNGIPIVVAVPSLSSEGFEGTLDEARQIAGENVVVEGRRVGVSMSAEPFLTLVQELDPSDIVVPLVARDGTRALQAMKRAALSHPIGRTVAVDTRGRVEPRPREVPYKEEKNVHERRGLAAAYHALLRGSLRVRLGLTTLVTKLLAISHQPSAGIRATHRRHSERDEADD